MHPFLDPARPATTVGSYLDSWLAGRRSLRPSTRLAYEIHIRRHLKPYLGDVKLTRLTAAQVDAVYSAILTGDTIRGPMSVATVRRVHATLMSALTHAVQVGLIERNPAAYVDLPRAERPRVRVWSATELNRFLAFVDGHRLHPVFLTLALTGMRRGEVLGLRWADVDLAQRLIRVEQQLVAVGAQLFIGPPKSSAGRRVIALPDPVRDALLTSTAHSHADRTNRAGGPGWVFCTPHGQQLTPGDVTRQFERLTAAAGLPRIRLHDLRHTSASLGLQAGESLLEVSRRLGHSTISITADVYSHIAPDTARASADRLTALLAQPLPLFGPGRPR